MNATERSPALRKLELLKAELADLAYELELRGRCDAAELANAVAMELGEIEPDSPHYSAGLPAANEEKYLRRAGKPNSGLRERFLV